MKKVDMKDVEHILELSKLTFTEQEKKDAAEYLDAILKHFETLNSVDTSSVPPTAHILDTVNVLREDIAEESMPREKLLKNAPESDGEAYVVPRVVE